MNHPARVAERKATYQDVIDAPPHQVAEIVGGRLHLHPRPASRHAHASSILGAKLVGPFGLGSGGPGGWWIVDEPELHLGEEVLVPDLAGWRRERMPEYPDAPFFELAPDWLCEVLSPGTRRFDLTEKRAAYAREGVAHLWFIDPLARTLEVFALDAGLWRLLATLTDAAEVRQPPFEAAPFGLAALWPEG